MACLPDDVKGAAGLPVTKREMQGLLTPLQSSLQRMEEMLQDLSAPCVSPLQPKDLDAWVSQLGESSDTPTTDLRDMFGCLPTPNGSGAQTGSRPKTDPHVGPSKPAIETKASSSSRLFEILQELNGHANTEDKDKELSHLQMDENGDGMFAILTHAKIEHAFKTLSAAGNLRNVGKVTHADMVAARMDKLSCAWSSIREPPGSGWIKRFVMSHYFEYSCQAAIILNSALVAYITDWEIQNIGEREPPILDAFESSFVIFFFTELIMRLIAHRHYFFVNDDMPWNIFDLVLVTISVGDFVLAHLPMAYQSSIGNVGFVRLLRILKLARIFRTVRLFRFCSLLPVLVESLRTSLAPLFWGWLLLMCVLYLFALIFIQALIGPLNEGIIDPITRQALEIRFGSLGKAMLSLYLSVTGGDDWANIHNLIWVAAGNWYSMSFCVFVFLATVAVFNIITGLIVERAMSVSKPGRSELIIGQRKKFAEEKREFLEICRAIDSNGSGTISWPEFKQWIKSPLMVAYMASLGCDIYDVELFFATVGARQAYNGIVQPGEVTFEHFVDGCMHMKGTATSIDMQRQLFEMHILQENLKQFEASCLARLGRLEHFVMAKSSQHVPENRFRL